jgi:hypothetical protein
MHLIKPELRRQDLEGIHLPSFRFFWKLKKLCRVDFFVFESWQTDVMVLPCDFTAVCQADPHVNFNHDCFFQVIGHDL